jgi:hypothetical protein
MKKLASRMIVGVLTLTAIAALLVVVGCDGGGGVRLGSVTGFIYMTPDGGDVIISANRTPPDGYVPATDTVVYIKGHPELRDVTDANGQYFICCIPPGRQTIVVEIDARDIEFIVNVQAGEVVVGGGHVEGGG